MLEISQIKEIIKKPKNLKVIQEASRQEARIKFHCETVLERSYLNRAATEFLRWVETILPRDKFATFLSVYKYPVDTVRLTEKTFQALSKVFESRNPVTSINLLSEDLNDEAAEYIKDQKKFWSGEGFETMKTRINSFVVVDLPEEQEGEYPDPYQYILDIDKVLDYVEKEYLLYEPEDDKLVVVDKDCYQLWNFVDRDPEKLSIIKIEKHDLGFAPFNFFWDQDISSRSKGIKKSPISNWLGQLDWILFYHISKKCADLYAPWSIYWGYIQDCDYADNGLHESCHNGFLQNSNGHYVHNEDRTLKKCPACSDRIAGVGAFIDVPPPQAGKDALVPPAGIIPADVASLEYNVGELERLSTEFYQSITGISLDLLKGVAINEKQVTSMFESQKQALMGIKRNLEKIINWTESTKLKLRYGNAFDSFFYSLGTEWYLFSEDMLIEMYAKARSQGLDTSILDFLQDQLFETKFKNNPDKLRESKLRAEIDPFRHLSVSQVKELYSDGIVHDVEFYMKANLSSLIMRFERENGSILTFGEMLDYGKKISKIIDTIKTYFTKPEVKQIEEPPQIENNG